MEAYKDRKPRILIFKESMGGDLQFLMETDVAEVYVRSAADYFTEKKKLLNKEYDFILATPWRDPVWHSGRPFVKNCFRAITTLIKKPSTYFPVVLRRLVQKTGMRLGIVDSIDAPLIAKRNFGLLDVCHRYFKRELPQNHYNIFLYTTARNKDAVNIVRQDFFLKNERKLRPIQFGISDKKFNLVELEKNEKEYDIFYAGKSHYCTVRQNGIKELLQLKGEGVRVYLPEERLSPEDFYRACGKSRLVLSPAGLG
ncbi:MAG: hypothetical protein AB1606_01870 [Nitrospirota bacterium]